MKDTGFIIIMLGILVVFVSVIFASALKEKIASDLIIDMAQRGYIQTIKDNRTLWIKDEKN
jgi:hypothetical protein